MGLNRERGGGGVAAQQNVTFLDFTYFGRDLAVLTNMIRIYKNKELILLMNGCLTTNGELLIAKNLTVSVTSRYDILHSSRKNSLLPSF